METRTGLGAIRSMDYVILLCEDMGSMKRFYSDVLGFEIEDEVPENWIGTLYLRLRPRGRGYDGDRIPVASASAQLSFRVPPADVDAAYEELTQKGIEIIEQPTNQDWTHRTLFLHDPEFNIIEIYADIHPRETLPAPSGVHLLIRR